MGFLRVHAEEDVNNTIDDGIYRLDGDSRLVSVNDALVEITGYTREELLGEHVSVLFGGDSVSIEHEIERLRANASDQSELLDLAMETAEGGQIRCEMRMNALDVGDAVQGAVGTVRVIDERKQAEPEATEATFRRLFENVPGNYLIVQPGDYEIVAVSDAYLDATMTERAEILGKTLFEIFPDNPDDPAEGAENLRESLDRVAKTGKADTMPVTHYPIPNRESGGDEFEERWWNPINSPVFDTAGELDYIVHSVEDITPIVKELQADGEQELLQETDTVDTQLASDVVLRGQELLRQAKQEAYKQLRESEERFRALVTTTSDVVFSTNADWSEMRSLEGADFFADTGEQETSWVEKHVPPADQPRVQDAIDEAIRTKSSVELEHQIVREDGTVAWIVSRATPLLDENGEITQWLGAANDVTERVERERYLEDAKERLEAATEAGAVGTWEWHIPEDQMVTGASFAKKFGIDPDAATEGVSLDQFISAIHDDDRERVKRRLEDTIESGEEYEEEYRVWDSNNELRWVVARGHVEYDDDGNPVTFPGALSDITERKQFEQRLEESNKRLEQFAYAASHDLQEPLRMVTSYLQLIDRRYTDELDKDGEEFIEFAIDGADRMRNMIEGLLEYSRIETRGDPFEPIDLDTVLADVRQDLQMCIEESGAEITAESLPRVEGDPGQLRQVFQNLLSNAIEYSDDTPRVEISAVRNGPKVVVSVADEGIGIDPDDGERVFEIFQSLHAQDEYAGTGIGLAICKRIIERHGGDIWVESDPGEGATFSFTLPAASGGET
ncbi:sensor box histidine kinase [Natrialba magadii ATCC 43099]|uniref:histidine kinase n=1 Tax=Natrialba magadii (strain ATCC 43099 / DSM 3394 / CCM 3739 / CIP 104546 / IAM 13178 / JCM 8861 / NBRC 102185 / NCIMB 2190 / MS3) TaxID=547559 RepID=D3SX94_NATMM|nr:PAS domain S-box protein [Natrialba magadii]ADD03914.1 sensor box histidine kinase [Natrialba magadii ATCC 43099]ELY33575.1 PAS/PAC sensor signal transduction histidine kinase [Natrialba magadii ATCC 43099]